MPTHAQVARHVIAGAPPGVFARAAREAVIDNNTMALEAMLPGVKFAYRGVAQDAWELVGTCADGSTCVWRVAA